MSSLPLNGIRVIDLTHARSGPACVRVFADWGADVIHIEPPAALGGASNFIGSTDGSDFQNLHRNKRFMTLNLKSHEGLAIFLDLVRTADVLVENMRADVKTRLGIDYDSLHKINPRLIYGSISGFGQDGPYSARPGVDQIAQGMGGLMSITGQPGAGPQRVGIPITDLCSGAFLAQGLLIALIERQTSGLGRWVRTSLLESMVAMLDFQATRWLVEGEVPGQAGNNHPTGVPTGVFATQDGQVNIAATGAVMFARLCMALNMKEMLEDPRFGNDLDRLANRDALNAEIEARTRIWATAALVDSLNAAGVPCGPIHDVAGVFADPQVQHLEMVSAVDHPRRGTLKLVKQPVSISGYERDLRVCAPDAGSSNGEILAELAIGSDEIARLARENII